jgi:hypothetical protein
MLSWGKKRTVRAAVIRHLLASAEWPVHQKGVRLRGVRISGPLDLEAVALRCPLMLDCCYLDAEEPVCFDQAVAVVLRLTGCVLAGITGEQLAAKAIDLTGSTFKGPLNLRNGNISGDLRCAGAHLEISDHGGALLADGLRVGGSVLLDRGFTATGAVRLVGADIAGQLVCSGARLTGRDTEGNNALHGDGMKVGGDVFLDLDGSAAGGQFMAAGLVSLVAATIAGKLQCTGAQLTGANEHGDALVADGIKVGRGVLFNAGFTASAGAVRLLGASITGHLDCRGARLTAASLSGYVLAADRIAVSGNVYLQAGFTATGGAVQLPGANITGQLRCSGAHLGVDQSGCALAAERIKVGGDMYLDAGFTAAGAVRLSGAEITGQLRCGGAQLKKNHEGVALACDGTQVGRDLFLDEGFTATGELVLKSARVGGSAMLGSAAPSIGAAGLQVVDSFRWLPAMPVEGTVSLEGVSAAQFEDHWTQDNRASNGYWPVGGKLQLDGFTYGRFSGEHQATVPERLGWIRSQYKQDEVTGRWDGFNPQPYEQLAAVYRNAGRDSDARLINIARRADLRRYGNLGRYRKFGNRLLDWTIRYGYQTWRAAAGLAAVFVVFLALSIFGQHHQMIVPIGNIQGLHPVPSATKCTSDYPCFYPLGYTVDTVIPIINVHQADHWGPDGHARWGWVWISATWVATGLGWSLATLLAAGYTGLARRD